MEKIKNVPKHQPDMEHVFLNHEVGATVSVGIHRVENLRAKVKRLGTSNMHRVYGKYYVSFHFHMISKNGAFLDFHMVTTWAILSQGFLAHKVQQSHRTRLSVTQSMISWGTPFKILVNIQADLLYQYIFIRGCHDLFVFLLMNSL